MEIEKIAQQLSAYCRNYQYFEAHEELYWHDAESYEPGEGIGGGTKGVRNIEKKWDWFRQTYEPGIMEIGTAVFAGKFFTMPIRTQVIIKETGKPLTLEQIGLYEVRDGKIAREWFYYGE